MGFRISHLAGPRERRCLSLEEPFRHHQRPQPILELEQRVIGDGARPECPDLLRERIVSLRSGHFLDEIDLTRHVVGPISRDLHLESVIHRLHLEPEAPEKRGRSIALEGHPEQSFDPGRSKVDPASPIGPRTYVDDAAARFSSRNGENDLGRPTQGLFLKLRIHPSLEPIRCVRREPESLACGPDGRGREEGAFEKDGPGGIRDFGVRPAHDPGDRDRRVAVADG
jgi:hypothetical protein